MSIGKFQRILLIWVISIAPKKKFLASGKDGKCLFPSHDALSVGDASFFNLRLTSRSEFARSKNISLCEASSEWSGEHVCMIIINERLVLEWTVDGIEKMRLESVRLFPFRVEGASHR